MPPQQYYQPPVQDKANVGLAILSYLIPIAGLIIYLTQKDTKPKNAKVCGKCALASVIINVVIIIVSNIILAVVGSSVMDYTEDTYDQYYNDYYDDYSDSFDEYYYE